MKTWQSNLKWQVLHFSCSTLEIRYLTLTEVIIFITCIKEANICHLPDFLKWFHFSFPSAVVVIFHRAGANAVTLKIGIYFILPGHCTWSSLLWAEGEKNPRCSSRSGGSSLWTRQDQTFPLGWVGGSCPAACPSRGWPVLHSPAAGGAGDMSCIRMLSAAPWGSAFPFALQLDFGQAIHLLRFLTLFVGVI